MAELEGLEGGTDMATVSEALYNEWFAGVRAEHLAEGIEQGIVQGIEQGIEQERARGLAHIEQERARGLARLRRQAAIKFGARTAERLSALLGTVAAGERMERLGDRVSDWIVECEQGEDLLSRLSAWVENGGAER